MKGILQLFIVVLALNLSAQTTDWVQSFGGPESDKGISIGVDSLGFIYISGFYNNEATFGSITLSNSNMGWGGNNKENFIAKLDSNGNVLWAIPGGNQSGGCCDDRALGMHVTPGGDVFITGTFWSSYKLGVNGAAGTINVTTGINQHDNSLLAKIDTDGNPVWAIGFGGDNTSGGCSSPIYDADDHSYDVKVDADGFIYVTGFFSGYSAEFDGFSITNNDWDVDCQPMGYIGKLDANGNWIWVDKFDGIKDQRGSRDNRLAIDKFSNIYVVGGFQNTGNYGPFSIVSNGEWDAFIFKMDKDGNWLWAKGIGSNKTDRANSIAIDVCDDIYITGEYRNPMVFPGGNASNGTDTLSHKQKRDVFVAKMNNQGEWKWAKRARTSGTDKPYQMSVDANKQVFIGGTAKGEMTFTNGIVQGPQIAGDTTASAWVAQLDGSTSTGDWLWAKMAGSDTDDDDRTGDICPDGYGNVYAIGFFEDLANFDGTILDATNRKKDIFVWKMSMTPGSFTYNNTNTTIYQPDSMVFSPADTGIFTTSSWIIDGCDTTFVDSVVHRRLGARIVFTINNFSSSTNIIVDGISSSVLPFSIDYYLDVNVNISSAIDPLYGFISWNSNNINILPNNTAPAASFNITMSDTIKLNIYKKPTIVYDVFPAGTMTSIDINGVNTSVFPSSVIYYNNETITLSPNIDPLFSYVSWEYDSISMLNGSSEVNSFISAHNDTVRLIIDTIPPLQAFISGNDTICSNDNFTAEVHVSFRSANWPCTFVYSINGVNQPPITTTLNPHIIYTTEQGVYSLVSFSDANKVGSTSGSAIVTVNLCPNASFHTATDTLSILFPSLQLTDITSGDIIDWKWDFGDNTPNQFVQNPYHTYKDIGIYQVSMIITDNMGCRDTATKYIWVADKYWMYIPNSFSPDNDGVNDVFCLEYNGVRVETFSFMIYDRFSNLVYTTDKIQDLECFLNSNGSNGWNGTHYKTKVKLPVGTYIYEVYFQDFEGWKHQEQGHLFIVR